MRGFTAAPNAYRCKATRKPLRDGTLAQCMRRATCGDYCAQHEAKAKRAILADPRVWSAWDEHDMDGGVWVSLKGGYQDASNPGSHSIHEYSWTDAYAMMRGVVPCHCEDCRNA